MPDNPAFRRAVLSALEELIKHYPRHKMDVGIEHTYETFCLAFRKDAYVRLDAIEGAVARVVAEQKFFPHASEFRAAVLAEQAEIIHRERVEATRSMPFAGHGRCPLCGSGYVERERRRPDGTTFTRFYCDHAWELAIARDERQQQGAA